MKSVDVLRTLKAELKADIPRLENLFHKYEKLDELIRNVETQV